MTFEETLAEWMPSQRWFAGKGARILDLAIVADTELVGGDPGLHHLIVAVSQGSGLSRASGLAQDGTLLRSTTGPGGTRRLPWRHRPPGQSPCTPWAAPWTPTSFSSACAKNCPTTCSTCWSAWPTTAGSPTTRCTTRT